MKSYQRCGNAGYDRAGHLLEIWECTEDPCDKADRYEEMVIELFGLCEVSGERLTFDLWEDPEEQDHSQLSDAAD